MIHVPAADLGRDDDEGEDGDGATPRKKTRRGTRGGRNRRKKTAATGTATVEADAPETTEEPETVGASDALDELPAVAEPQPNGGAPAAEEDADNGAAPAAEEDADDWDYTPMSEWGMDGDRRP